MKLTCISIDDEPLALELMEKFIRAIPYLEPRGEFESAYEAMETLRHEQIDLIFLDINMPDINGVQFIKTLSQPPMVIFTTAYEQYALEGFEINAVDYLLKPFSRERFLKAVERAYNLKNLQEQGKPTSKTTAKNTASRIQYLLVKSEYSILRVNLEDILYLEALKDYVKIYTRKHAKPILTLNSLKALGEQLDEDRFVRVHRSFMVALAHIDSIRKNKIMIGDHEVPTGELYQKDFQEKFFGDQNL